MDFFNKAVSSLDPLFVDAIDAANSSSKDRKLKNRYYRREIQREVLQSQLTQKREQELLEEVQLLNDDVTRARKELWTTQDQVAASNERVRELTNHVNELLQQRVEDDRTIQHLKEENMKLVEGELKVRESLDLMKTVFTRAQLKARDDQETITTLRKERDTLQSQLRKLMRETGKSAHEFSSPLHATSYYEVDRLASARTSKEERLKKLLTHTDKELNDLKGRHAAAIETIQALRQRVEGMQDPVEASRELDKQRRMIDRLEQQIADMELQNLKIGDDEEYDIRDDDAAVMKNRYEDVVNRAFCDEDLDGSLTQQVIATLDCSSSFGK